MSEPANPRAAIELLLNDARRLQHESEQAANQMASLLDGNLKHVSHHNLARLKKQLAKFNIHTNRWGE